MAQFITLPQYRNPWVQNLPTMLQNMALQKVGQRFRREENEKGREFESDQAQDQRAYQKGVLSENRQYQSGVRKEEEDFELLTAANIQQVSNISGVPKNTVGFFERNGKVYAKTGKAKTGAPKTLNTTDGIFEWSDEKRTWVNTGFKAPDRSTKLTVGEDGSVSFTQGSPGPLTKTNITGVQKNVMSLSDRKGMLESMSAKWQPHYNTFLTKGSMWLRQLQEKAEGLPGVNKLAPEKQKELSEYISFRTTSSEDFAKLIHELGGATLTPHETRTYGAFIQNAKSDSPTVYMTKLKQNYSRVTKQLAREHYYLNIQRMSQAEYNKLRTQNKLMSVAAFDKVIDQKYAEYTAKLRSEKPDVPWEQIKAEAMGMISASFFGF